MTDIWTIYGLSIAIISALISLFCAVLSTWVYLANLRENKLNFKVDYNIKLNPPANNQVEVIITNLGKPIHFDEMYLEIVTEISMVGRVLNIINQIEQSGERYDNFYADSKTELEKEHNFRFTILNIPSVSSENKRYRLVIVDQLGKKHTCKNFKV